MDAPGMDAPGIDSPALPPGLPDTPPTLRLSRDRTIIAYVCSPVRSSREAALPQAQAVLSRWQTLTPEPPTPFSLSDWLQRHTVGELWATGQLLLTPQPQALGGWLWLWATQTDQSPDAQTRDHSSTNPSRDPVQESSSLLPSQHPLAQRLQLSPLALLHYTQARCHALAQSSPAFPLSRRHFPGNCAGDWVSAMPQPMLRTLAQFTDHLATATTPTPQGAKAGLELCAAVDTGLREMRLPPSEAEGMLLAAIAHSLRWLLMHWLYVAAPDSLSAADNRL